MENKIEVIGNYTIDIPQAEKRKSEAVELNDIIKCIVDFDDTETDEIKGRYFSTIQRDLRNLQQQQLKQE